MPEAAILVHGVAVQQPSLFVTLPPELREETRMFYNEQGGSVLCTESCGTIALLRRFYVSVRRAFDDCFVSSFMMSAHVRQHTPHLADANDILRVPYRKADELANYSGDNSQL